MRFSLDNFLYAIKQIVMGGGRMTDGTPHNDAGFLKRAEDVNLQSFAPTSNITATAAALTVTNGAGTNDGTIGAITADASVIAAVQELAAQINKLVLDDAAIREKLSLTADETNARVLRLPEDIDTIGNIVWAVPRDYDEATDELKLRVLASMETKSTDTDVQLDSEFYIKSPGVALTADQNPSAPGTVLSTTEQWVEINLSRKGLQRDDVAIIELITNSGNNTAAEEVLIHAVELVYRSCLVSYDEQTSTKVPLR